MLADIVDFIIGKDAHGRWTAVAQHGQAGGIFVSRAAALRYARLETGRRTGAVRQSAMPISLSLANDRIGPDGEGLPHWWRSPSSSRAAGSLSNDGFGAAEESRKWLIIDIGIAIGFAVLCIAAGLAVS